MPNIQSVLGVNGSAGNERMKADRARTDESRRRWFRVCREEEAKVER